MATSSSPQSLFGYSATMRRLEAQFELFQNQQGEFATQVNNGSRQTGSRIAAIETTIRDREDAIRSMFEQMVAQRAAEMAALVADARAEFDNQRQQLQSIIGGGAGRAQQTTAASRPRKHQRSRTQAGKGIPSDKGIEAQQTQQRRRVEKLVRTLLRVR